MNFTAEKARAIAMRSPRVLRVMRLVHIYGLIRSAAETGSYSCDIYEIEGWTPLSYRGVPVTHSAYEDLKVILHSKGFYTVNVWPDNGEDSPFLRITWDRVS